MRRPLLHLCSFALASIVAFAQERCGDIPCVISFGLPCSEVVEAYRFKGQCCSLATGNDGLCELTVSQGSCSYYVPTGAIADDVTNECVEIPDSFLFPSFIEIPEGIQQLDGSPVEELIADNTTLIDPNSIDTASVEELIVNQSDAGAGILSSIASNLGGSDSEEGNPILALLGASGRNESEVNDIINNVAERVNSLNLTNISLPDIGSAVEEYGGTVDASGIGDALPGDLNIPGLDAFLNSNGPEYSCFLVQDGHLFVHVSFSQNECPASTYDILDSNGGASASGTPASSGDGGSSSTTPMFSLSVMLVVAFSHAVTLLISYK